MRENPGDSRVKTGGLGAAVGAPRQRRFDPWGARAQSAGEATAAAALPSMRAACAARGAPMAPACPPARPRQLGGASDRARPEVPSPWRPPPALGHAGISGGRRSKTPGVFACW